MMALMLIVCSALGAPPTSSASPGTVVAWGDLPVGRMSRLGWTAWLRWPAVARPSIALNSDGTVAAWGDGGSGSSPAVTLVLAGLSNLTTISANGTNAMALRSDGSVVTRGAQWCSCVSSPPNPLTGVHAIAAGWVFDVVAFDNWTVGAWGDNYVGETNVPAGLSGVIAVSAASGQAI